ncbi:MAG: DUF1015 domain-containing protein [Flavobacteriales bacterium]|nr:DUF1015 domain-containing protein [Flavobacteriales bacterium]
MNWIRPFTLIAPPADKSHLVASRSYLTYSKAELRDKLERNPYSYLHVINPTGIGSSKVKRGTVPFFEHVRKRYLDFKSMGWLQLKGKNCIAIYRQSSEEHACTGIIGSLSIEGIRSGHLKLHEQTLKRREQLFAKYLHTVQCNAEPVLCSFDDGSIPEADAIQNRLTQHTDKRADLDFTTTDQIRHSVWILSEEESTDLAAVVQGLSPLYLADGHHRVASSLALDSLDGATQHSSSLMAYIIPESQLLIRGYHRELMDAAWSAEHWDAALQRLQPYITAERISRTELSKPKAVGTVHLHTGGQSWVLSLRECSVDCVDAEIIQNRIFEGLFGIEDARNNPKLRYIPGTMDSHQLIEHSDYRPESAIFEMHPVSTDQIKASADRGGFLPPKSSWVEPKLRSGLFIHEI